MAIVKSLSQAPMGLDDEMMSDEICLKNQTLRLRLRTLSG
jgi:hypothetical protein